MCAGKDHVKDTLHQPVASAHAAAFAFGILSFRSKVPTAAGPLADSANAQAVVSSAPAPSINLSSEQHSGESEIDFAFSFEGSRDQWPAERVERVVERLKQVAEDEQMTLIRVDAGSVRLVMRVKESTVQRLDSLKLQEAAADCGATLISAAPLGVFEQADRTKEALHGASASLLAWDTTLPGGKWMPRPEKGAIESHFESESSSTVVLGEAGSGKSALLSKVASELVSRGAFVFAIKADLLSPEVATESDLQRELGLPAKPGDLILQIASLQQIYVFIDQLDAIASRLDLKTGRLNVLLNLIRRLGRRTNVHVVLSARNFEFNHDVRLRAIEADAIQLTLPPWHEVSERLSEVGIDAEAWPERAREIVRIPQALKIFLSLARSGRTEPYVTYQAMLEQLWQDRIAASSDSEALGALASDIAEQMAADEVLWLAASRFDDRLSALRRLEAIGFIVWSESRLSVGFSHQTIFEYILARTFVRRNNLLSAFVLERQDSLFVRAKVWAALTYLRGTEANSYEREFSAIWKTQNLRRHLRLLLIEFLGQQKAPLECEVTWIFEALAKPDLRVFVLNAIAATSHWMFEKAPSIIRAAMAGGDSEAAQAVRILASNWKTESAQIVSFIKELWLTRVDRDRYAWAVLHECLGWNGEVEELARVIVGRTPISTWQLEQTVQTLAVEQPDVAIRLVRAKLEFLLEEARRKSDVPLPDFPAEGEDREQIGWHLRHRGEREFEHLLESTEWHDLPALAEATPALFLFSLWPWYVTVFDEILKRSRSSETRYIYPGQYVLDIDMAAPENRRGREKILVVALQTSVEEVAVGEPDAFMVFVGQSSALAIMAVQQLVAHGFTVAAKNLASEALTWLLADQRRLQLGTGYGLRVTTIELVRSCAPFWSPEEVKLAEQAFNAYDPPTPEHLVEADMRKTFIGLVRATRKDLLDAMGVERLSPESQDLVAVEKRALGGRYDRTFGRVESGWIGSPMEASAMAKAKDGDILNIFREIPDDTNWDHPQSFMRGGNIQLSRAFAEFARSHRDRAIALMEKFEPSKQGRAAGYALDSLAEDASNDSRVIEAILKLSARGFQAAEFRDSVARAIEKIVDRKADVQEEVLSVLVGWLRSEEAVGGDDVGGEEREAQSAAEETSKGRSILWGHGNTTILPGGNFPILSTLATILLNRGETGRDRLVEILEAHLAYERDADVWKALLYRMGNAGGKTPEVVSSFLRKLFERFPDLLESPEGVVFLAYAQNWDDQLVLDLIRNWPESESLFRQQGYGELVGLVSVTKGKEKWILAQQQIVSAGKDRQKIGLAHAAVNLWPADHFRSSAGEVLVALLAGAPSDVVAVVMDVFRVVEELNPDSQTIDLLKALADPNTDLSEAPPSFVVERLQSLLPYEAGLVAAIAKKLVAVWRDDLGDVRTSTAMAAPDLTNLALTLHRLGGESRQAGIDLFENMIDIGAQGANETLVEIDGRFGRQQPPVRPRLFRRRPSRTRRSRATQ